VAIDLLPFVWPLLIAFAVLAYVIVDGFRSSCVGDPFSLAQDRARPATSP